MATAKKAAAQTEGTQYTWGVQEAYSINAPFDDTFWGIGDYASLEAALNSADFGEYMRENNNPARVYVIAMTKDGKAHRFHRIGVKQSGYTFKEV